MPNRLPWLLLLPIFLFLIDNIACGQEAIAQSSGAVWPSNTPIDPDLFRGGGFYFSLYKLLACLMLFFCWVKTADWVNQDLQFHRLQIYVWNPIVVGSFSLALLLVWFIPYFWLGLLLLFAAYVGPVLTYVFHCRNPVVDSHVRVLTPTHLLFWSAKKLAYIGIHIDAKDPAAEFEPEEHSVALLAVGGEMATQDNQVATLTARQLPGYMVAVKLLTDAFERRATAVRLNCGEEAKLSYQIDDIWHRLPSQSLETGKQIAEVLACLAFGSSGLSSQKQVEGTDQKAEFTFRLRSFREFLGTIPLNVTGRRDKFEGYWEEVFPCMVSRKLEEHADRWLVTLKREVAPFHTLPELGMREQTAAIVTTSLEKSDGMLVFSSLPGGGLTTTLNVALEGVDRYMRDFVSIEDKSQREPEIVNVDRRNYDSKAGQSPADIIPTVSRSGADVIVCRNLVNTPSAKLLCELAESEHLIITTIPARDSVEALLRILVLKVPADTFAAAVSTVVHSRLIRVLCEECRESYTPSAELLKKLGIPQGRIKHLFRSPTSRDTTTCNFCDGIGYRGRIGIYEVLTVTDKMRAILTNPKPQIEDLRKAARESGFQTELEHGKLLVARGVTSIEELQRIFKS